MIIDRTQGQLDEIKIYARKIGRKRTLNRCIKRLEEYTKNGEEVHVFTDWAPYSLYFERMRNGAFIGNGGIILHGKHDRGGDGGAPTFSTNLNPSSGWSIHT